MQTADFSSRPSAFDQDGRADLNLFGMAVARLFRGLDNIRMSTISIVISVLTAVVFVVGVLSTGLTLHNVSTIAQTWRDFDTGLGRRIDLLAQLRGHLGYGGLVQHWDQWQAGNEQVKGLLSADIQAIRELSPAWQSASPGPEEREALASVLRTVDAYEAALKQGAKGEVDSANQIQQSLTRISGILQQERASGADRVEDAVWRLGFTVGGVMLFSAALLILLTTFFFWFTRFRVLIPIRESGLSMRRLADGDKTTRVPFVDKTDEMGEMARTVEVFRDNMIRADRLEMEKRAGDQVILDQAKRRSELTDAFGVSADRLLAVVDRSVAKVRDSAQQMLRLAEATGQDTAAVAVTAGQASSNVQQVAASAEEMGASIQEIGSSVSRSTDITKKAVEGISALDGTMADLEEATLRVGEIVAMIGEIAAQTNLLALNASIEAQRAGDAGKGFAVVAGEVKTLAGQTARATGEISEHINEITAKTRTAVVALKGVVETVTEADTVVSSIAAAINQQSAATGEIVRNVHEAAISNTHVSETMEHLAEDASQVKSNAASVVATIEELGQEASEMQKTVRAFLKDVR